jgi:hypothetical protein
MVSWDVIRNCRAKDLSAAMIEAHGARRASRIEAFWEPATLWEIRCHPGRVGVRNDEEK